MDNFSDGETALSLAKEFEYLDIVKYLSDRV